MTHAGRLHPLLLHFPIALVIVAAFAELVATLKSRRRWHIVSVANVRAAAVSAVATAATGWFLAASLSVDDGRSLHWHGWLGTAAALATIGAAFTTVAIDRRPSTVRWAYRIALWTAAVLVGVTGHLGATLVWGADFLRP